MDDKTPPSDRRGKFHPIYLCVAIPFAALLWVPLYDRVDPTLFGIPFFYWWQMAWTLLGALTTWPVYKYVERTRQ
jgi:hypothetical protein